ncbi:type II toxin-antitoxin system PemK/MazF family toxin [Pseudoalteromonas sp. Hal273]
MTIRINYVAEDDSLLGVESYEEHSEVLIPDYVEDKHDVYLNKSFEKSDSTVWKVLLIESDTVYIKVKLLPQQTPKSLGETASAQNRNPSVYLQPKKYQLVEVEFGFQKHLVSYDGNQGKNKKYTCALLPGDLYKKRPCIVIKSKGSRVKVIPLTSDGNRKDPWQLQIHSSTFKGLANRYSKKDSFALLDTVQTVSVYRVFPMRQSNSSFSNDYNKYCLIPSDSNSLESKIAELNSKHVVDENIRLKSRVAILLKEVKAEKAKRRDLSNNLVKELDAVASLEKGLLQLQNSFINLAESAGESFDNLEELVNRWQLE